MSRLFSFVLWATAFRFFNHHQNQSFVLWTTFFTHNHQKHRAPALYHERVMDHQVCNSGYRPLVLWTTTVRERKQAKFRAMNHHLRVFGHRYFVLWATQSNASYRTSLTIPTGMPNRTASWQLVL